MSNGLKAGKGSSGGRTIIALLTIICLSIGSCAAFVPSRSTLLRERNWFNQILHSNDLGERFATDESQRTTSLHLSTRLAAWKHALRTRKIPSKQRRRRFHFALVAFVLLVVLGRSQVAHAVSKTAASEASASELPTALGMRQIVSASSLVAIVGGLGLSRLGLVGLAKQLMVACARCTLQLQLLGGLILQWLLPSSQPWLVGGWILGVGIIAAQESYGRLDYTYPKLRRHLTFSFLTGGLSVLGLAVAFELFGKLQPWYKPQTLIPVAGMLFGNTLSTATLATSTLTRGFATQQNQVELWLARGATYEEAVLPLTKSSIQTALMPLVNSLSVTGIVHLPGMMTGQILAGQLPRQAAVYQTLIWFLITSVATATVQVLNALVTRSLVDTRQHRLQLDSLSYVKSTQDEQDSTTSVGLGANSAVSPVKKVTMVTSSTPAFRVHNLLVKRANAELSLQLHAGDRVGITGPSGIGKSQILRTLVGLESVPFESNAATSIMEVHGTSMADVTTPEWRTKVSLVSQDRPTETGTPREFYEQAMKFHYQKQRTAAKVNTVVANGDSRKHKTPMDMASQDWNLSNDVWDRPWSTLSGGEAQRASLAIALALEPDVLLLDEATSALDEANTVRVESTLRRLKVPMILVTHEPAQLTRFCTHHMDLSSETTEASKSVEETSTTSTQSLPEA